MGITERSGNLLDDDAEVLVNTTNAAGPTGAVMGNGLAKAFAQRWPAIVPPYKRDAASGLLRGGVCRLYELPEPRDLFSVAPPRFWAAFCTKHDWRNPSRYEWIESGLRDLVDAIRARQIQSVAIPALGCSNGRLDWMRVRPMVESAFAEMDTDVRLYGPGSR